MDIPDRDRQRRIHPRPFTRGTFIPRVITALGQIQQSAQNPYRVDGLVHLHEPEERFGIAVLSFANQAAA